MIQNRLLWCFFIMFVLWLGLLYAEPIVIRGSMVRELCGTPLKNIRLLTLFGKPVPFQIDEVTAQGEYVLPDGDMPNSAEGNGVLDTLDEIVFRRETLEAGAPSENVLVPHGITLTIGDGLDAQKAILCGDPIQAISVTRPISYQPDSQIVRTPFYYAQFGNKRFHFISAGIQKTDSSGYIALTNELRILIKVQTLFGLLPIQYTENNIVCTVKRYKAGPVRLIRRGDFYLSIGAFVKAGKASVNQICYPDLVCVPVLANLPFMFKRIASEAYIEMTPVMRAAAQSFTFTVPSLRAVWPLAGEKPLDTLVRESPNRRIYTVGNGTQGYSWMLDAAMPDSLLSGSGYVLRRPSLTGGIGYFGFRLAVRNLPRGSYRITNWVFFNGNPLLAAQQADRLFNPVFIRTGNSELYKNNLQGPRRIITP